MKSFLQFLGQSNIKLWYKNTKFDEWNIAKKIHAKCNLNEILRFFFSQTIPKKSVHPFSNESYTILKIEFSYICAGCLSRNGDPDPRGSLTLQGNVSSSRK